MRRQRILIVEDNQEAATAMQDILPDFDVELAGSIREAKIRLVEIDKPRVDCLILDLSLPNGVGVDNVRKFQLFYPDTPMVVATGLNEAEVNTWDLIRAGAQEVLRKPIKPAELRESVMLAIARHEVRCTFSEATRELKDLKAESKATCDFMAQAMTDSEMKQVPRPRPGSDQNKKTMPGNANGGSGNGGSGCSRANGGGK